MKKDIISDLLTRIRNAITAKHSFVKAPAIKITDQIVEILKEEGYIKNFEFWKEGNKTSIIIILKYIGKSKKSVITTLTRVSKPGMRVYINSTHIPKSFKNFGIGILSTSQGVMTTDNAKKMQIGGELLCQIS